MKNIILSIFAILCVIALCLLCGNAFADIKCGDSILTEHQFRAKHTNSFFPVPLTTQAVQEKGCSFYTPPVVDQPPQIPQSLTRKQALLILKRYGLLDTVKQTVAAIDAQDGEAKLIFDNALTFDRDNQLLNFVATQAGMTSAQIDQMFIEGAGL